MAIKPLDEYEKMLLVVIHLSKGNSKIIYGNPEITYRKLLALESDEGIVYLSVIVIPGGNKGERIRIQFLFCIFRNFLPYLRYKTTAAATT